MIKLFTRIIRNHTDPKKLESISEKPFFKHYKSAINLSLENKLEESNSEFAKSLQQIKATKQNQMQHFSYILRRMAHNYRRLGQMKKAEQKLYDIIKHKRDSKVLSAILYDDYDILFRHMLSYDLQKAAKLCKALLIKEKDDMPLSHVKLFNFNLGTAYLLSKNYVDAKSKLGKCLESDPQGKLKSYALNNLGLACWWHKNPIQKSIEYSQSDQTETIEKSFRQAKQIFAKAIMIGQSDNKEDELRNIMLQQTLDFKNGKLNQHLQLHGSASLYPAYNISRFYVANDPLQRLEILYWLKKSLNLAKLTKNQHFYEYIFCEYCLLTHNVSMLQQKLPNLIEKYRYTQCFAEEQYFCEAYSMLLSRDQKNKQKAQEYSQRANLLRKVLPEWTPKLRYIAMDPLNLTS